MRGVRVRSEEGIRGRRGGQSGGLVLELVLGVVVVVVGLGLGLGSFLGLGILFVSFSFSYFKIDVFPVSKSAIKEKIEVMLCCPEWNLTLVLWETAEDFIFR